MYDYIPSFEKKWITTKSGIQLSVIVWELSIITIVETLAPNAGNGLSDIEAVYCELRTSCDISYTRASTNDLCKSTVSLRSGHWSSTY